MWADQGHRWPYCLSKELELNLAARWRHSRILSRELSSLALYFRKVSLTAVCEKGSVRVD